MLEREVFIGIMRMREQLLGALEKCLAAEGISEPQFNILRILRGAGKNGLPTRQIAERLITRQPDVTRLIDRLDAAGLVRRRRCEEDRRIVYVLLTAAGRKLLARMDGPLDAAHRKQFAHMPRQRLMLLAQLLAEARGDTNP